MNEREALDAIRALCERPNAVTRGVPTWDIEAVLDRVESSPPPAIDRDVRQQVVDIIRETHVQALVDHSLPAGAVADRVLALVRPVAGVTLTPEERALIVATLHSHAIEYPGHKEDRMEALAARLEAGDA